MSLLSAILSSADVNIPLGYLYKGIDPTTIEATTQTGYKWSFASKKTRADEEALRSARQQIAAATYGLDTPSQAGLSSGGGSGRVHGPTLPSASDLVLARELASENQQEERSYKRKRDKLEAKERMEEIAPREVGREGMLEKKRARRDADRDFRDKGDDGLEADESTLLGGGDSFKAQCVHCHSDEISYQCLCQDCETRCRKKTVRAKIWEGREGLSYTRTSYDIQGKRKGTCYNYKYSCRSANVEIIIKATMDMFQQMAKRFG